LISTGASDWLNGSGKAERVEGGWRVTARKIFGSGVPAGDYLITGAVCDDPETGATVLHFPLSLKADGVHILDTWRVRGCAPPDRTTSQSKMLLCRTWRFRGGARRGNGIC